MNYAKLIQEISEYYGIYVTANPYKTIRLGQVL